MHSGFSTAISGAWQAVTSAMPASRQRKELSRLVRINPPPLIHPEARLIVVFSAKSACTSVIVWFMHQVGHAEAAQAYSNWPHRYRIDVYHPSSFHQDACRLDLTGFRVLRVVRDPFERAASSFRHVLRHGNADEAFATFLGRSDIAEAGASFCEFLDVLDQMDLTTCNAHFRIQRHPIEHRLPVTHLINVSREDLYERLNQVEAELGLPITDFEQLDWLQRLDERRDRLVPKLDIPDAYAQRFSRQQANAGPWPPHRAFLTPAARERVARLYAADIAAYGPAFGIPPG